MSEESWTRIDRFPDYEISSLGRVRRLTSRTSAKAGRIKKASLHYRGYFHHGMICDGKLVTVRLNRLVCEAFHGPAPSPEHQAAHNDGDTANNAADNLRWATKNENEQDKNQHGTRRRGTAVRTAKLTEKIVADIRRAAMHEKPCIPELAKKFGTSETAIRFVLTGKSWPHVRVAS